MELRSMKESSFRIILLLLLHFLSSSLCQNCGVPRYVNVRQSEQLRETLDTGQHITTIPVTKVKRILSIHQIPQSFAKDPTVELYPGDSQITFSVDKALWSEKDRLISYIDEARSPTVEVILELECDDGRSKEVTFNISIIDENTEAPFFEHESYELKTEPCVAERCAMVFETEILIIDKDRDEENALVKIHTDSNEVQLLSCITSIAPWYNNTDPYTKVQKGYQTTVRLSFTPKSDTILKTFSFIITAENQKSHVTLDNYLAFAKITIHFEEWPGRVLPPVFSSPFYYASAKTFGGELDVQPHRIEALVPWDDSDTSLITYKIVGSPNVPNVLNISSKGVRFLPDLNTSVVDFLANKEVVFDVIAQRMKKGYSTNFTDSGASAKAKLVVFFRTDLETPGSTVAPPTCSPECYSTPTTPETCPTPSCPTSEPCPGTTTEAESTTSVWTTLKPEPTTATTELTTEYFSTTKESTNWPTENPIETKPPEPPTDPPTTTNFPTTTRIPTTPPGQNCTCDCESFKCPEAEMTSDISDSFVTYHPDPHNCTLYHRCEINTAMETLQCPPGKVFCPVNATCVVPELCQNPGKGYGYASEEDTGDSCKACTCKEGISPEDPRNLCPENYTMQIPDPDYCDVFHYCQDTNVPGNYIDIASLCPPGLVYCAAKEVCVFPRQFYECNNCPPTMKLKQCDSCVMSQWNNFDIFKQRFKT